MKKSKSALRKKEKKIEKLEAQEGLIESEVHKDVKQGVLPPFEILEISKGAQRLNLMIDSWSRGIGFDGNESKDMARDLLKGALDLQESLVMLCNLQETPKHFVQMDNEHDRLYKAGSHSDRFTEKFDISNMLPARHSVDGSTRSSSSELKRVIRESLARQNLLSTASDQEDDTKKLDLFSDIPSTSSSQSSMANSNNSASMDWSVSSTSKETKTKSPNVIAKLMGLEEFPSQTSPPRLKQQDSKNIVVHKRLITDIEMPNVRNAYPTSRSKDPQKKKLKEVIDTMHLKGLLKDKDVQGLSQHSCNPRFSLLKENEETPPIVVIKPLPLSRRENGSLPSFRKLEAEEVSSSEMSSQGEGALEIEEIHNKVEARRELLTSTSIHNNVARKLKSILVKVEPKEKPIRRPTQQERNSNSTVSKGKREVREHRGKASANTIQLGSAPLTHKPEEKGARNKKHEEGEKVLSNRKMPEEKSNDRRITLSRSSLQDAATSVKSRKHHSSQIFPRDPILRQESPAKNSIPVRSRQSTADISPGQAKIKATRSTKPVNKSMTTIPTKRSQSKQRNVGNKQTDNTGSVSTVIRSDPEDHWTAVNDTVTTKTQIEDHGEEEQTSRFEAETVYSQQRSSTEPTERKEILDRQVKNKINPKELLLSNSSFLWRAEDLFEPHMKQPIFSLAAFSEDVNMIDTRLALDCANEILERKSGRISPADHSFSWIYRVNLRTSMSVDQLLGEVSQDFDEVINYARVGNDINKMVECDIQCKGRPISGAWELDWQSGFSVKEADQVFGELEKHILSELIEEIIIVDYGATVVQHFVT